jgi:hypothetical protein
MNSYGGEPQEIAGEGPYLFRFRPIDKPGLRNFILTVWTTPSGEWSDRESVAQYQIGRQSAAPAEGYKSPQVHRTNFLLETYFATEPNGSGGVLLEKMGDSGYSLTVNDAGGITFAVRGDEAAGQVVSRTRVNDGAWHHVIAEADRADGSLTLYIDGRRDGSGAGVDAGTSLANAANLYVGGTPEGRCLAGRLEFVRVSLGTLADAKTTIEELYAWQFEGPFLRDWNGRRPDDGKRDAGAIERQ